MAFEYANELETVSEIPETSRSNRSYPELDRLVAGLAEKPAGTIVIAGRSDKSGRATSLKAALTPRLKAHGLAVAVSERKSTDGQYVVYVQTQEAA